MISALREIDDGKTLHDKLMHIMHSRYTGLNYLTYISNSKSIFDVSLANQKKNHFVNRIRNFNIPTKIAPLKRMKEKSRDIVSFTIAKPKTCVEEFCERLNNFVKPLDVINAAVRLNLITEEQSRRYVDNLNCMQRTPISLIYNMISNRIAKGILDKEKIQSYQKKFYPLGIPNCTGCEPEVEKMLNLFYISIKQHTYSNRVNCKPQVTTDLERVEDDFAATDVEIALNENVRRHLIEYGWSYLLTSTDTLDELNVCFGKYGSLSLRILSIFYNQLYSRFIDYLFRRAIGLGVKRILSKPTWSKDLERIFPPTRSQHRKPAKLANDFTMFEYIMLPIQYSVENVAYLSELMEKYFVKRSAESKTPIDIEVQYWRQALQEAIGVLRNSECSGDVTAGFSFSALLAASATLVSYFSTVRALVNQNTKNRQLANEIGITDTSLNSDQRVFDIIIEVIVNKKKKMKEGAQEMAGLFKDCDLNLCQNLIKVVILTIKAMKYYAFHKLQESPVVRVYVGNGKIDMAPLYGPPGNASIPFDIFRPKESFK